MEGYCYKSTVIDGGGSWYVINREGNGGRDSFRSDNVNGVYDDNDCGQGKKEIDITLFGINRDKNGFVKRGDVYVLRGIVTEKDFII